MNPQSKLYVSKLVSTKEKGSDKANQISSHESVAIKTNDAFAEIKLIPTEPLLTTRELSVSEGTCCNTQEDPSIKHESVSSFLKVTEGRCC